MSNRAHSKAYLESLLQPPIPSGAIGSRPSSLVRTSSGIGLTLSPSDSNHYKPVKSSGLAVEGDNEVLNDNEEEEKKEERGKFSGGMNSIFSVASSISSASEDDDLEEPSKSLRIHTTPSRHTNTMQMVQAILQLLDEEDLDDEVRIEKAREMIAADLNEVEGFPVTSTRLDNIVLALLHRHREDVKPTGATFALPASPSPSPFPASPRSRPRPASLRSISGTGASQSRPWTPTLPLTPTSSSMFQENGPSAPSSPLLIPQTISIGSGSPKASPSLWHRSLSNSATLTATPNPWTQSTFNNSLSSSSSSFAPLGPPGDTIGSPPKTALTKSTPQQSSSTVNTISRPISPGASSNFESPRLNVAAVAFKPRITSGQTSSNQITSVEVAVPWSAERRYSAVNSSEDSDEDEFSPFTSQSLSAVSIPGSSSSSSASSSRLAVGRARPVSGISGNSSIQSLTTAESISGSYQGSTTSASLESSDDQRGLRSIAAGEDDLSSLTMTPFDVLSSILSSSSVGASSWTNEELEEALEMNNWDIDATLTAIMDSGGMPNIVGNNKGRDLTPSNGSSITSNIGRSGVSLVSRDSFNGQRGPSGAGNSDNSSLSLAQQQQQMQMQGVGPGRVCRYFLAGECRRADCRFSHDLNRAVCRFWMRGQCLNGEGCSFLHDMSIVDRLGARLTSTSMQDTTSSIRSDVESSKKDDFPELGMAPTGPKSQRGRGITLSNTNDPSRTRWAQAVQKRITTTQSVDASRKEDVSLSRSIPTGPKGSMKSGIASRIPLRAPLLLPTLSTGRDASRNYVIHREKAIQLSETRNKMLIKAADAWKRGDGMEAKKWSKEAQDVNKSLQEESRTSFRYILKERHKEIQRSLMENSIGSKGLVDPSMEERGSRGIRGKLMGDQMGVCLGIIPKLQSANLGNTMSLSVEERMEVLLDLHLMHSTEAMDIVEEFLMNLERENYRGLALLATGLGKHTSQETDRRRVGLAAGVKEFLSTWAYPFSEHNGVIVVDPLTHL